MEELHDLSEDELLELGLARIKDTVAILLQRYPDSSRTLARALRFAAFDLEVEPERKDPCVSSLPKNPR
jgi:hypothetical protein